MRREATALHGGPRRVRRGSRRLRRRSLFELVEAAEGRDLVDADGGGVLTGLIRKFGGIPEKHDGRSDEALAESESGTPSPRPVSSSDSDSVTDSVSASASDSESVRPVFAIDLHRRRVLEWSLDTDEWQIAGSRSRRRPGLPLLDLVGAAK